MGLLEYKPPAQGDNPVWWPLGRPGHLSPQLTAIHSKAQVLLYGGASGGGKTDFLVGDAIQEYDNPNLRALLIRKSISEMQQIQDRCRAIYTNLGAFWRDREKSWIFPSGARVRLGYMANDGSIAQYQGNPFSWLGFDESTYMPENQVRDILPWLATVDPSLFPRARLTTNPGQIGAAWHIHVFLRGHCPLCQSDQSVEPGVVYRGAKWMDGRPVSKTVSFIPARVEDNPLYGQDKIDSLDSQTEQRQRQLKLGCWCKLEGMFFGFLDDGYRVPAPEIPEEPWHIHFLSMDYGYMGSAAATGLYYRTAASTHAPMGRIVKIGECVERQMGSEDYAKKIAQDFILRKIRGQQCKISACYFDPAMDAHTGNYGRKSEGLSNAELIANVFSEYGVPMLAAAKDRIGNAMKLYGMLKRRELVITTGAPRTFTSLKTRMHDPDTPGAVLKVKGEDLDDLYDETAFGVNTFLDETIKPREIAMAEQVQSMREEGLDEHSIAIHTWRMQHENPDSGDDMVMGRSHGSGRIIRR